LKTQIYLYKLKSYKEYFKAIKRLYTKVIKTIYPNNFHYILGKELVYNILMFLKNQFIALDYT
jgi:hypothetical protein